MSSTTFWIIFCAPVVLLALWRIITQRHKGLRFAKRLVFSIAASALIFMLYVGLVEKFWHPPVTDDLMPAERLVRGKSVLAARFLVHWNF